MRKALFFLFGAFAFVAISIITFEFLQKPEFSSTLSQRSKEFIKNQSIGGGINKYAPLIAEKGEDTKSKTMTVGDCFSFVMPYSVFNMRQEGECNGYFAFNRPKGSIVAFMEEAINPTIDEAPGVLMRRLNPEDYEEKEIKIGEKSFVGFVDKRESYTITIYHLVSGKYFIMTLNLPEEDEKSLKEILFSLEFL